MPQAWEGIVDPPVQTRVTDKPRATGYTMVLDKGMGIHGTADLMQMAAHVIDSLKLTFGTSAFYEESVLREKIALVQNAGVDIYPGGTFLEAAVAQGKVADYVMRARELGFNTIEVSDGTIEMDAATRGDIIKRAKDAGFKVLTEVGKKDPKDAIATTTMHEQIAADLAQGADKVIVEARESGHGVGIFDSSGDVQTEMVEEILGGINNVDRPHLGSADQEPAAVAYPRVRPQRQPGQHPAGRHSGAGGPALRYAGGYTEARSRRHVAVDNSGP